MIESAVFQTCLEMVTSHKTLGDTGKTAFLFAHTLVALYRRQRGFRRERRAVVPFGSSCYCSSSVPAGRRIRNDKSIELDCSVFSGDLSPWRFRPTGQSTASKLSQIQNCAFFTLPDRSPHPRCAPGISVLMSPTHQVWAGRLVKKSFTHVSSNPDKRLEFDLLLSLCMHRRLHRQIPPSTRHALSWRLSAPPASGRRPHHPRRP